MAFLEARSPAMPATLRRLQAHLAMRDALAHPSGAPGSCCAHLTRHQLGLALRMASRPRALGERHEPRPRRAGGRDGRADGPHHAQYDHGDSNGHADGLECELPSGEPLGVSIRLKLR